jgi:solute carrier family 35, member E3
MPSESENRDNSIPLLDVESQKDANGASDFTKDDSPPSQPATPPTTGAGRKFLIWTAINMLATIGIVFTNKAIFNDPDFKMMQTSFASFHFVCTGLTLWVVSRPRIGAFVPKRAGIVEMLPVSQVTCFPPYSNLMI